MVNKYPVVTLCGSTRFKDEFEKVQKKLTLHGNIVLSVGFFSHCENKDAYILPKTREMLDDLHKRKIDMADSIFVINVGGYIGESTKSEIEYALSHGKEVMYLEENQCAFSNENEIEEAYQYYMEKNFGKEDTNGTHNI